MDVQKAESLLQKNIKWLSHDRDFLLRVHDTSGVLHKNTELKLDYKYMLHNCTFCNAAKSTITGLRFCLKCKGYSIKKAMLQKECYVGQCYLGITEIVKPVYYNDKLYCVIYLGNLLMQNQKQSIYDKIQRICGLTGVTHGLLVNALESTKPVMPSDIERYKEIVEVIHRFILLSISDSVKPENKPSSYFPIYGDERHWVVQAVENYVAQYYDRDISLSQLAKLYFMNSQYLCRLFKKEKGANFIDYVNTIRLQKAEQLLASTDNKVIDISMQIGYNNVAYFNRLFKRYSGLSPGKYRQVKGMPGM